MNEMMKETDKREVIRKAAIKVFAEQGFHNTTTDKVAKEAGVAVGTIYNYFQNKADVLEYIFEVEYQKRKTFYEKLKQENLSSVEKLRSIMEKHFTEVKENPELIKIILEERQHTSKGCSRRPALRKIFEEIILDGRNRGELREVDPEALSMMLFGSIEAVMREYLSREQEGKHKERVFERVMEETTKLFYEGLVHQ